MCTIILPEDAKFNGYDIIGGSVALIGIGIIYYVPR